MVRGRLSRPEPGAARTAAAGAGGRLPTAPPAVPAAASLALRMLVAGPVVPGRVSGAFPTAVYVEAGGTVVAVVSRDGIRLPNALVLADTAAGAGLAARAAGTAAAVGAGGVRVGNLAVRASRWWDPRPRLGRVEPERLAANAAAAARRADRSARAGGPPGAPARGSAGGAAAAERLRAGVAALETACATADADAAAHAASRLLGLGDGLTPAGDDVLAGTLAGLGLLGEAARSRVAAPLATRLAAAVAAPGRTTALSAALLQHAAAGEVAAPVARACRALAGREPLGEAVEGLWRVGHTSGRWLLHGLVLAAGVAARG